MNDHNIGKREIKFRAWDIDGKRMVNSDSESWIGHYDDLYFNNLQEILNPKTEDLNFKFMQYTGLKDKNGKEIYEGDIVLNSCKDVGIVIWREYCADFVFRRLKPNYYESKLWDDGRSRAECGSLTIITNNKILGNKFDNPELLKI